MQTSICNSLCVKMCIGERFISSYYRGIILYIMYIYTYITYIYYRVLEIHVLTVHLCTNRYKLL